MEAFVLSTGLVALAEIGDKTQLLALMLAARWKQPRPVLAGIFFATLANHAVAAALGAWMAASVDPQVLRWALGASFLAMALWTLRPDRLDAAAPPRTAYGVFGTTFVVFFIAEIGDKTQVATVALAAQHAAVASVLAGTTLGMMIANAPAVVLGHSVAERLPMAWIRRAAALLFALVGAAVLAADAGDGPPPPRDAGRAALTPAASPARASPTTP